MDPTHHVDQASIDQVLSIPAHGAQSRSLTSPHEPPREAVRPRTAASSVHWEEGTGDLRPLSVRTYRTLARPQPQTTSPTATSPSPSRSSSKQKFSIFNIFSVKEPSSQALREYEDVLKKQQNNRKGRPSAVGLPMTSAAKLPANVPKVNSKWDGLPESMHHKQKNKTKTKWKTTGSDDRLSSAETFRSAPPVWKQRDLLSSSGQPGSHENKKVASMSDISLFRSDYNRLNQSSTSTSSWTSTLATPSSTYNSSSPVTRMPDSPVTEDVVLSASKGPVAVVNISSSKNSPGTAVETLQLPTFPFPDPSKPVSAPHERQDIPNAEQNSQSGSGDNTLLSSELLPRPRSSQSNSRKFSKLKKKKSYAFKSWLEVG